jgi:uncharacterized membrane protein YeaQ/YmgE (transglycosylase-associated protein family)
MQLVWSLIVGFLVGLLARAIMPGADHMGLIATTMLGIVGSLIGGFIGGAVIRPADGALFHPPGLVLSVVGALIALFLWQRFA